MPCRAATLPLFSPPLLIRHYFELSYAAMRRRHYAMPPPFAPYADYARHCRLPLIFADFLPRRCEPACR